jgi:hypothetical protein
MIKAWLWVVIAGGLVSAARAENTAFLVGTVDSVWLPVGQKVFAVISNEQKEWQAEVEPSRQDCGWQFRFPKLEPGAYTVELRTPFQGSAAQAIDIKPGSNVIAFPASRTISLTPASLPEAWDAAAQAEPGSVIVLAAGEYLDPIKIWRNKQIVLRGTPGKTHLRSTRPIPYQPDDERQNGKALWVMAGEHQRVEYLEISGAKVPDKNGAALRIEGKQIDICGSYLHHNENGILGNADTLYVRQSELAHNGLSEDGQTHNIYLVGGSRFTLEFSYVHHAHIGHNVKSRAINTHILYNRIMDEADGTGSYAVDIPNGGFANIIGNIIQQGPNTDNSAIISYGTEGVKADVKNHLRLIHNTLVNDLDKGSFVQLKDGTVETLNNLVVGEGDWITEDPEDVGDYLDEDGDAVTDREQYNYQLNIISGAVGSAIYSAKSEALFEYRHLHQGVIRDNAQDAGALAFARHLDD